MPDLTTCINNIDFYSKRKDKSEMAKKDNDYVEQDMTALHSEMNEHRNKINAMFGVQDWEGKKVRTVGEEYHSGLIEVYWHTDELRVHREPL
ncbi:MAG: hypothetical protein LBS91_05860 [Clostridiales Family XIII bacterium]|jgi:uncharacterized coiled-coil DUF342 family protein|nr:hypothetical protein [Clostridiales Family XIII bacterium]